MKSSYKKFSKLDCRGLVGGANELFNSFPLSKDANETDETNRNEAIEINNKRSLDNDLDNATLNNVNSKQVSFNANIDDEEEITRKMQIMNDIMMIGDNSKNSISNKKKVKHPYDPTINNIYCSSSTFKYLIIAMITLMSMFSFLFLFIVGLVNYEIPTSTCDSNIAKYLFVMGACGLARLLVFYSCPFDYSKSIFLKMYEHLVWRLIINRIKNSYYLALETKYKKKNELEQENVNDTMLSDKFISKINIVSLFIYEFCCCSCFCLLKAKRHFQNKKRAKQIRMTRSMPITYDLKNRLDTSSEFISEAKLSLHLSTSSKINKESNFFLNKSESNISFSLESATKSYDSNLSQLSMSGSGVTTTTTSRFINELTGFKLMKLLKNGFENDKKMLKKSKTIDSIREKFKFLNKKSKSTSDLDSISKRKNILRNKMKEKRRFSRNFHKHAAYGNRYFYGRYGNKYGTNKHLKRHHNKTYKPYRLIDVNTIRYCLFYLIQRTLDVFMISWFIAGNYWVFGSNSDNSFLQSIPPINGLIKDVNNTTNSTFLDKSGLMTNLSMAKLLANYKSANKYIKRNDFVYKFNKSYKDFKMKKKNNLVLEKLNQKGLILNNQISNLSSKAKLIELSSLSIDSTKTICYQIAFYQIISTYLLLLFIILFVIGYRIYLVFENQRHNDRHDKIKRRPRRRN